MAVEVLGQSLFEIGFDEPRNSAVDSRESLDVDSGDRVAESFQKLSEGSVGASDVEDVSWVEVLEPSQQALVRGVLLDLDIVGGAVEGGRSCSETHFVESVPQRCDESVFCELDAVAECEGVVRDDGNLDFGQLLVEL